MIREDVIRRQANEHDMPREYGFHYSNSMDMIRNATHVLQHFNKWPDKGGYFDQDAFLVSDILMYKALEAHIEQSYKDDNKPGH